MMHPAEIDAALKTVTLLVDTREHLGSDFEKRIGATRLPFLRKKLDFGDYSAICVVDGIMVDFSKSFVIERKMNLDELAMCYTSNRDRFTREFERAAERGAKTYLLVEEGNLNGVLSGQYRSRLSEKAFTASIFTWLARYNCQYIPVPKRWSGRIIREIVLREVKERLNAL